MTWALQDAKAKFSEVVRRAQAEGPQRVTLRGQPAVVVISEAELEAIKATAGDRSKMSFDEFLVSSPVWPDDFVEEIINRPKSYGRDVDL